MNDAESVAVKAGKPPSILVASRQQSLVSTVKAVAWSFIGVRGNGALESDAGKVNPLALIGVGIVLAAGFVALLIVVVNQVAKV